MDISYVWTREGWLYLAVILDPHSRRVIALRVLHAKPFRVTVWAVSNRMQRDLAIRALEMAIAFRSPPKDCINHTDRPSRDIAVRYPVRQWDSQYCSHDYQKILRQHGFKMSPLAHVNMRCRAADERQGQLLRQCCPLSAACSACACQAMVETFFKTIKDELIWRHPWETRRKAEMAIFEYINAFYNPRRRHSALGWKSPVAFERKVA